MFGIFQISSWRPFGHSRSRRRNFGHSFGGQLAALVAEGISADSLPPIFINPALGAAWDRKLRRCWRRPWRFFKLVEELGYNDGNVARSEFYHAGMLLLSIVDMFRDRDLRPYRRLQATMALLLNRDTASILGRLMLRGIQPVIVQGALDRSTPAADGVHFVDGFRGLRCREPAAPRSAAGGAEQTVTRAAPKLSPVTFRTIRSGAVTGYSPLIVVCSQAFRSSLQSGGSRRARAAVAGPWLVVTSAAVDETRPHALTTH